MGSFIEINDTLQITTEQGFPAELDFETHKTKPFTAADFAGRVFTFKDKPNIRIYKAPPVRNFLAHNVDGTWRYWGHIHMVEVTANYQTNTTSGSYTITKIFTPEEMAKANFYLEA